MVKRYGFRCDNAACRHEALDDTTVNGWTCPKCKNGHMQHDINVKGGRLDAFTGVGGYPLIYVDREGDVLCADCAFEARDDEDARLAYDVYYEGPPEQCAGCQKEIESAYGDPDADKDDEES